MTEVTNDLIYEVLKAMQARLARFERDFKEIKLSTADIRNDIHGLNGHLLRHDSKFVHLDARLERIERRLELVDS